MAEKMFSFEKLKTLYNDGPLKDHTDAKEYIAKFFYPLTNGTHALFQDGKITIIQREDMNDVYITRFPDGIKKWYKTES